MRAIRVEKRNRQTNNFGKVVGRVRTNFVCDNLRQKTITHRQLHYSSYLRNTEINSNLGSSSIPSSSPFFDESPDPENLHVNILESSLQKVKTFGWTVEALSTGAEENGLPGIAHGMFPDGPVELVNYFIEKCNIEMIQKLSSMNLQQVTMKERLRTILQMRLEMLLPYSSNWSQALSVMGQPQNLPKSLHGLALLIDEILHQCGDKSTDFDWYTKRALVTGIYVTTELYLLTDATRNKQDTWDYLDRRIDDFLRMSTLKVDLEKTVSMLGSGVFSLVQNFIKPPTPTITPSAKSAS